MTAYEVSVSKLAVYEAGADYDIDDEFELYSPSVRPDDDGDGFAESI